MKCLHAVNPKFNLCITREEISAAVVVMVVSVQCVARWIIAVGENLHAIEVLPECGDCFRDYFSVALALDRVRSCFDSN